MIDLELWNTQSDKSAGSSDRKEPRMHRGLPSRVRRDPALQNPASGHPTGRPLQIEREAAPLGYVLGQFTSNSPLDEFARGEGGYGIRFGRAAAVIISPSPTARHPHGDERDLLSKAAVRAMAADRAHRL